MLKIIHDLPSFKTYETGCEEPLIDDSTFASAIEKVKIENLFKIHFDSTKTWGKYGKK